MKSEKKVVMNISTRDYSKRLYKATYENYLTNEGVDIFLRSREELMAEAKIIKESFGSKSKS